jgi:hypothetical protein
MQEAPTLHVDLSHLAPDQNFTLRVGTRAYPLAAHTPESLARARESNAALAVLPDARITHFTEAVRVPANHPVMLRISAPRLRPDDPLERLLLTAIYIPRPLRAAGIARRRAAGIATASAKLVAMNGPSLPADDVLLDIGNMTTALDAAKSLVFHHPELLAFQGAPAEAILDLIEDVPGIVPLANSILGQSQEHENDPTQPNWVTSQPGHDGRTGQPTAPIYVWSDETLENLALPLQNALRLTKNKLSLEGQCWSVQLGITQVPSSATSQSRPRSADAEASYTVKERTPQSGVSNSFGYDPSTSTATITLTNSYLRWLQVSVDQYGPGKEAIGTTAVLGQLSPVDTIMAVPLPAQPSDFPFTFDEKAQSAIISIGGLGQAPFDWKYDGDGIILTSVFNYAVPTAFIALGVAVDQGGSEWTDLEKSIVGPMLTYFETVVDGPIGWAVTGGASLEDVLAAIANCVGALLLDAVAGSDALEKYVTAALGESAIEDAIPFIGWVARAIGSAADLASMIETSVEVARSPATMSLSIVRTMDVLVTVEPDPKHKPQWPATATHYLITITYDDGPTYTYAGQMDPTTQQGPIAYTFPSLPAGGSLTVLACFYSADDWLAGQGKAGSTPAQPNQGSTLVLNSFAIQENPVPLSSQTTYSFKEKLGFAEGARVWLPASSGAPMATVSDLDNSNVGANLSALGTLSINEPLSTLGYLWTASGQNIPLAGTGNEPYTGQISAFQAISDAEDPESNLKFPGFGYIASPCIAFPPPTAVNPAADGFWLEPDANDSSMLLRALSLQPGQPFLPSRTQSFGRFQGFQDDLAIHPAGYAVALGIVTCTLQVLKIGTQADDAATPAASLYGGQGARPGLLSNPAAVACSLDKILVLQTTTPYSQGCIVAFDFKGNPVNCFGAGWLMPLHAEDGSNVVVLDLSVESKGYLYVLKYLAPSSGAVMPGDYRLDLYAPDGSFLTQVAGLAAARLQVDLWRNVFTLNYEIVEGSGRTEPSVALWIPSTPAALNATTKRR